jgi:hypothetical protein
MKWLDLRTNQNSWIHITDSAIIIKQKLLKAFSNSVSLEMATSVKSPRFGKTIDEICLLIKLETLKLYPSQLIETTGSV